MAQIDSTVTGVTHNKRGKLVKHTILVELKIESPEEDSIRINERVEALLKHGTIIDAFDTAGLSVVGTQSLVAQPATSA